MYSRYHLSVSVHPSPACEHFKHDILAVVIAHIVNVYNVIVTALRLHNLTAAKQIWRSFCLFSASVYFSTNIIGRMELIRIA